MTLVELLILLVIAAVCGSIGQVIAGYTIGGWLISIGVGLIGALVGRWLASEFGLSYMLPINIDGESFPIVWAIIGSVIFTFVVGMITRKK